MSYNAVIKHLGDDIKEINNKYVLFLKMAELQTTEFYRELLILMRQSKLILSDYSKGLLMVCE